MRLLLRYDANVNQVDINGNTALHLAATNGKPLLARLLLEFGANKDKVNKDGSTPIQLATIEDHKDVIMLFHKH